MDSTRFDALARSLAAAKSRRGFLGSLAALGAGLFGARSADAQQVTQAYCGNVFCNGNGCACRAGCVCCLYTNSVTGKIINSRCRPPGTCSPGTETVCAPPTTTTTTTANPNQGTCPTGANSCSSGDPTCNGSDECFCFTTLTGATVCAGQGVCSTTTCVSDADCTAVTGAGSICSTGCIQCPSGTGCQPPCGIQGLSAARTSTDGQQPSPPLP